MNLLPGDINNIVEYKRYIKNVLVIDWQLGNVCNYKCSYCFSESNSGNKRVPELDSYLNNLNYFLDKIDENNLKASYIISGGEPTVYANLEDIIYYIKERKNYISSLLVTNGSRTLNWWQKNLMLFDNIAISFHIETANKEHILELCKLLNENPNINITLTLMMHPYKFNECMIAHDYFLTNDIQKYANLCVKSLDEDTNNIRKAMSYTEEQNNFIKTNFIHKSYNKKKSFNNKPYDTYAIDVSNNRINFQTKQLAYYDPDFTGWDCMIGTEHITINYSGDIVANCKQNIFNKKHNLYYGNLKEENFNFLMKPVKCSVGKCRCLGLYDISKKISSVS